MLYSMMAGAMLLSSILWGHEELRHYVEEGKSFFTEGGYCRAIQEFSCAVTLIEQSGDFSDLSAYTHRGDVYYVVGDYHSAIADYSFVVDHSDFSEKARIKEFIKALSGRCFCFGTLGYREECNEDFSALGKIFKTGEFEEEYQDFIHSLYAFQEESSDEEDDDPPPSSWLLKRLPGSL